jgi:hypothetical protein
MVPTLPIAAIAVAWLIVIAVGWLMNNWRDLKNPTPRNTAEAFDAAFDRVVTAGDWLAAGMPSNESSFSGGRIWENSDTFFSHRRLGKKGTPQGWLYLTIERPDHMKGAQAALIREDVARGIKLADGFESGSSDLTHSWHVFAGRRGVADHVEDLVGWCFHDNAYVHIEAHGTATPSQVDGFTRLISETRTRLAAACASNLRPYLDRVAERAGR